MSDHLDTPYARTDITDLYAFQKPGDPARSILILNVNPDAPRQADAFDPAASYELKVDTDGDLRADLAYHALFAASKGGGQSAAVYRVTGEAAEGSGATGGLVIDDAPVSLDREARIAEEHGYRFYAGLRSDPFFVDPEGFFNDFRWTGKDANIDKNVFGIALELPNTALGPGPAIRIWARTIARRHGEPHQMDQVGRPGTSPIFLRTEEDRRRFNASHPVQHLGLFLPRFVAAFRSYGFAEDEAHALAREWLPDVLSYDYTSAAGYPNGRKLDDDIVDHFVALVTRGTMRSERLGPHTDLLPDFPYLGPPHGI